MKWNAYQNLFASMVQNKLTTKELQTEWVYILDMLDMIATYSAENDEQDAECRNAVRQLADSAIAHCRGE